MKHHVFEKTLDKTRKSPVSPVQSVVIAYSPLGKSHFFLHLHTHGTFKWNIFYIKKSSYMYKCKLRWSTCSFFFFSFHLQAKRAEEETETGKEKESAEINLQSVLKKTIHLGFQGTFLSLILPGFQIISLPQDGKGGGKTIMKDETALNVVAATECAA